MCEVVCECETQRGNKAKFNCTEKYGKMAHKGGSLPLTNNSSIYYTIKCFIHSRVKDKSGDVLSRHSGQLVREDSL